MVSDTKKLANAMGGKTARPCDNCIRKRARWYCPADDAFLCQNCDSSVHSANPLARRHERVRLKTSSRNSSKEISLEISVPSWHCGFTKKARTPRGGKHAKSKSEEPTRNPLHLVPEICCDETETSHEENEEQLLYRVPIFDPFVAKLCTSANSNEGARNDVEAADVLDQVDESKAMVHDYSNDLNQFHGSLPSEMELAEFAADVESLLGKGLDDESFDIEGLGLSDCKEADVLEDNNSLGSGRVKVEDEGELEVVMGNHNNNNNNNLMDGEVDMSREPFELSFDYDSPMTCEDNNKGDVERGIVKADQFTEDCKVENGVNMNKKILLRLDYDGVISAWADQRSPWTTGERPELNSNECWPDCLGTCGTIHNYPFGEMGIFGHPTVLDGGREARVSRYREKRRTRLFSKKIRYEVRKLNAEKRPRMKGRFVKRANFSSGPAAFPLHSK